MRKILIGLVTVFSLSVVRAQMVSYTLIDSFSVQQINAIINTFNPGATLFFTPEYPVDLYKVTYMTPYKHMDSLVIASGAVAVPRGVECPLPLAAYLHGTVADRTNVPSYGSDESKLGVVFSSLGVMIAMPDYLGLGDSDPRVIIHPYVHAFHQGHTSVNMLRSSRQLADSLGLQMNGQLFLTGYSQGGFSTMATHKLIEEEYPNEFTITASAPMSGAYDLKDAQVDLITSDSVYPTPGYLPYIILAYHSVDENLQQAFPDVKAIFKAPYDSLMPALFYAKNQSMGYINGKSEPVPKRMVMDSFVQAFLADTLHPFRLALLQSHLLDWAPQAPVKLFYCHDDDQVTYLNSERAYDSWVARGAQHVEKEDLGSYNHFDCVPFAVLNAKKYFDEFLVPCVSGISENRKSSAVKIYPNPMDQKAMVEISAPINGTAFLKIFDLSGKLERQIPVTQSAVVVQKDNLKAGMYLLEVKLDEQTFRAKLMIQ